MRTGRAWEYSRVHGGIVDMENMQLSRRITTGLAIAASPLHKSGDIGLHADKKLSDFVQTTFDRTQARRMALGNSPGRFVCRRWPVASKHFVQVLGLPAESDRQRFQSSRAAVPLDGMALDFADNRGRHMGALREFALTPRQSSAVVFTRSDGDPLDRHTALRAFRRVVRAAGLPPGEWVPRELRHSFVSLLSDDGMPLENIARLVGHVDTTTTETVYCKQIRPVVLDGATAMDRIFPADNAS
jgi:hypothetical protein